MDIEKDVMEVIDGRRLQWFGHVTRKKDGRLPMEVMG